MRTVDVLVIGAGIAGLSAAARLAAHGETLVLERESAFGYHSSGRSATFAHFGIGNTTVRGLTAASLPFFLEPPDGFGETPISVPRAALFIATRATLPDLEALHDAMRPFADRIERIDGAEARRIVPVLRGDGEAATVAALLDTGGRKLDADALLQGMARAARKAGGATRTEAPVLRIARGGERWIVDTPGESISARILVDAAGAWADEVAAMAGVRPLGLMPMRRTIIGVDPPGDVDIEDWPFTKTVTDGFYMLPDAGRLLISPMDEHPSPPCDAQPEDGDMALAAWRLEEATTIAVRRIALRWAGLRSFVADRVPTAGYAPDAPGFFWLAGQGGYGLQTAPAMAMAAEALVFGLPWPGELAARGVAATDIGPERLDKEQA